MPNNSIQWGQGAVNNRSGWGVGATNNSIGWGGVHADSYGHDETNLVGGLAYLYTEAAIAAGGTGGNTSCANETFSLLATIPTDGWNLATTYRTLAETDGGTGGSAYCAQKTFSNFT